jgi:hypothetical protein
MITEKQFLDAIDIIKKYQQQINSIIIKNIEPKTDFMLWSKTNNISDRLKKAIELNYRHNRLKYVEDIKFKNDLMCLRNFGKRSIDEFFSIINNKDL